MVIDVVGTPFQNSEVAHGTCSECGPYRFHMDGEVVYPSKCVHRDRHDHNLPEGWDRLTKPEDR